MQIAKQLREMTMKPIGLISINFFPEDRGNVKRQGRRRNWLRLFEKGKTIEEICKSTGCNKPRLINETLRRCRLL